MNTQTHFVKKSEMGRATCRPFWQAKFLSAGTFLAQQVALHPHDISCLVSDSCSMLS